MEKNQRDNYLLKNTIIFAIGNFGNKMISFFLVPLYTNVLSTNDYGTVDLINTIGTVLAPVITINIGESVMRFSLDKDADKDKIMSIGLVFLILSTFVGLVIFPMSGISLEIAPYSFYFFIYTISLGYSQVFLCYLRGKEKLLEYSIGCIIQSLCIATFNIVFLLVLKKGIEAYFVAYIMSNVITAAYAFIIGDIFQVIKGFKIDYKLSKSMVTYSVVLIPNLFMWWIMNSSDRIMVTALVGTAANGIYAVAYKIPTLLTTVMTVFTQAWSYSAIRGMESKDIETFSNIVYNKLVSIVLIVAVGLLMIIKPFLSIYVEKTYYKAWEYTPYLVIGFVFMTLGSFVGTSYTVHKNSKGFLISGSCGAIINILLNWVLIPVMGVSGAALATCLSYLAVFIYRVIDTKKYLRLYVKRRKHIAGYFLLLLTAFTLFINSVYTQIILGIELLIMLILYKDLMILIFRTIQVKTKNRIIKS